MNKINVILKATEGCNLRCQYCYNCESEYSGAVLPLEKLERFFQLLASAYNRVSIVWHGGEPLMCGLDYMRAAMEIERRLFREKGVVFENSIQTNATLIDGEWIAFFKKHGFKLGVSFDGVRNEDYRQQTDKVLSVIRLLQKRKMQFGCLVVVADDEHDMLENYEFFKARRLHYALSPMFAEGGGESLPALTAATYAKKANELFDRWLYDTQGVNVRLFSEYIAMLLGSRTRVCTHGSCHGKWLSITPDGSLYNCGRDSMKQYCFGNLDGMSSIREAFASDGFRQLLIGAIQRRARCKESCDLFHYCESGCSDCAMLENGLENQPDFSCVCFREVFGHVREAWEEIVEKGIPLSKLNPAVRDVAAQRLSERI